MLASILLHAEGEFMNRIQGRNIYIVDLDLVVQSAGGAQCFAHQCQLSKMSSVWIRIGRGLDAGSNFTDIGQVKNELANVGVAIWGWHVPHCPNLDSAKDEADFVIKCASDNALAGILLDAEQDEPGERNYFLGHDREADLYASMIRRACDQSGRGLAFSSHDQPSGKPGFPFATFLKYVIDNCPQIYYRAEPAAARLNKSIADYKQLEQGRDFADRYRPVGNITIFDDVALPNVEVCAKQTSDFIKLMKTNAFKAYSFWCWDQASPSAWSVFHTMPV
jgi:hypothetical protein